MRSLSPENRHAVEQALEHRGSGRQFAFVRGDTFTAWDGGPNPCPGEHVDLILRGAPAVIREKYPADARSWENFAKHGMRGDGDIVAYRRRD